MKCLNLHDPILIPAKTSVSDRHLLETISGPFGCLGEYIFNASIFFFLSLCISVVFKIECEHEKLNYWLKISELSRILVMINDSLNIMRRKVYHPPHVHKVICQKGDNVSECLECNENILSLANV